MDYLLKVLSRDMHDNVKHYRNMQEEYREYIEMWVHEIKTPIASTKLLIENNNNEITRKIDTQIDRIENFVEQVLYYSRSDE
ncbi:histidine kinase dimerization/phospho-acceptor domain-containing protein, partial [Klebsiella pneumoniae]|uniref:histidine kinase dimerization/phospho-acceptor domain-containing protein n=1 Tax=Klebsiella pneumoniae TaxID=573 RepID=UPI0034DAD878